MGAIDSYVVAGCLGHMVSNFAATGGCMHGARREAVNPSLGEKACVAITRRDA